MKAASAPAPAASRERAAPAGSPNVLMVIIDDVGPRFGCYGDDLAQTPQIDRLAKQSLVMRRAYCQIALCSPSRISILTGLRPATTGILDNETRMRARLPNVITLPQNFKAHGYHTRMVGKVFHRALNDDDPASWSAPPWQPVGFPLYVSPQLERRRQELRRGPVDRRGQAWEVADCGDAALEDAAVTDKAIEALRAMRDRPFLLAVGLRAPHLPFVAPRRYWDLYPPERIRLPIEPPPARSLPAFALGDSLELRMYENMPQSGPFAADQMRMLIRGHYACISFVDAQIGRLLDALDVLELADRTIVIVVGDNGMHLGENGHWCKETNYESAVRVPLIVRMPATAGGGACDALVELVDVYPTLCDLCGIAPPSGLEGVSFRPLLHDPSRPWKSAVFHEVLAPAREGKAHGRAIRTAGHRLVEWTPTRGRVQLELYDLNADPGERHNRADDPGCAATLADLHEGLRCGWMAARPPESETPPTATSGANP